jgi:hypothetical protein
MMVKSDIIIKGLFERVKIMKIRNITIIISTVLLLAGSALSAESDSSNTKPYLGVLLDMSALPELLTKHLRLSPGQGVRIRNIQKNSPAEEAGLERDDIIIRIKDKDIYKYESVVLAVRESQVAEEIPLEIIHLGEHKQLKIRLEAVEGEPEWKYPPEPEIEQLWRPGKLFRMRPDDQKWVEILTEELPAGFNINKFFKEFYTSYHYDGDEHYTIVIEGNPNNQDSTITVKADGKEYKATVGNLDELPEKYRKEAEMAIKNACKRRKEGSTGLSQPPEDFRNFYFQQPNFQRLPSEPTLQQDMQFFDKIQKQMNQLTDQIKELEKSQSELLKRLSEKLENQQNQEQTGSIL